MVGMCKMIMSSGMRKYQKNVRVLARKKAYSIWHVIWKIKVWRPFHTPKVWSMQLGSLSNSHQHSANADVIADMKSKITASCWHFFADMVLSATSEVQKYQNKTREKFLYQSKYFKEF